MTQKLDRFLTKDGKIKQIPSKYSFQIELYAYLAGKFTEGKEYTEIEVNQIIAKWTTMEDYLILRRGLVDSGYMKRLSNGSKYWVEKKDQESPDLPLQHE